MNQKKIQYGRERLIDILQINRDDRDGWIDIIYGFWIDGFMDLYCTQGWMDGYTVDRDE